MNTAIKYTLLEYKQNYNELLKIYMSNYFDVDEADFIEHQMYLYRKCLDVTNYIEKNCNELIACYYGGVNGFCTPQEFEVILTEDPNFDFHTIATKIVCSEISSTSKSIIQHRLSFNKIISFLEAKLEAKKAERKTNTKTEVPKKDFKDFFIESITDSKILAIQKKYKEIKGKKMAYVIFLLQKEFKIINYSLVGRFDSRKHLVCALIEHENTKIMGGINKYFAPNDMSLLAPHYTKDNDYITLKTDIQAILDQI